MANDVFSGKTALVTGGSRGIGCATALRLACDGARVAVNSHARRPEADLLVAEITKAGGQALAIAGDVSNPNDVKRMVDATRTAYGPIDFLVHCAAVSIVEPASQVKWESWKRTMDVNVDGTFHTVYAVIGEMIERRYGRIVLLSSIAALRERENQVHYSASKAAVIAMTRCWAQAWARHNVRINCVCPGLIDTEMARVLTDDVRASIIQNTPMNRIGRPEEIASVIRFLLSDEASFMTGQSVVASGGRVMLPG